MYFSRACAPANETLTESLNSVGISISNGSSIEAQGSSGSEDYETTSLWSLTTISCIIVAFVFSKGKPFRKPIYTNYIFFCLLPIQLAVCLFILFADYDSVYRALQLICTPTLWRGYIVIMLLAFFLVSFTVEETVIENRRLWLYLKRIFKYQSQSQYRILHRKLQHDPSWPPTNNTQYANSTNTEINVQGAVYSNACYVHEEKEHVGSCIS
ncbi:hypothetical protein FKM82_023704 [Ascaphus truei]